MTKQKETPRTRQNRYKRHISIINRHHENKNIDGFFGQMDYLYVHFPEKKKFLDIRQQAFIDMMLPEVNEKIQKNPKDKEAHQQKAVLLHREGELEASVQQRYFSQIASEAHNTARYRDVRKQKKSFKESPPSLKPLKPKHLGSVERILAKKTARYNNMESPTPVFEELSQSKYFQPILELFALERDFVILTRAVYESPYTQAQYWHSNRTISFKEEVTKDSAIHELCHHAERVAGTVERVGGAIRTARKKDRMHFRSLKLSKEDVKITNAIYRLVISTAEDRELYNQKEENEENIVRIAQAIAVYGKDKVKLALPNLFAVYKHTFLDEVINKVSNKKEQLLDQAVTYIVERVFLDNNSEFFGKNGKAFTKQKALKEQLREECMEAITRDHPSYDRTVRAMANGLHAPLDEKANEMRKELFARNTFIYKAHKALGPRDYISVQLQEESPIKLQKTSHKSFTETLESQRNEEAPQHCALQ